MKVGTLAVITNPVNQWYVMQKVGVENNNNNILGQVEHYKSQCKQLLV